MHNADQVIAYIDQGGLSLPDRDYYIKDDADKVEMRKHLVEYVTQVFTLAGQTPKQAAESAHTVLMVETLLAADSMDRTKTRDPKNRDHKMTREEAVAMAPDFYLNRYFAAVGAPNFTAMNVTNPDFFREVNGVIAALPLDSLENLCELARVARRRRRGCRSRSWRRISRCGRRSLGRSRFRIAGSAASIWWMDRWARR